MSSIRQQSVPQNLIPLLTKVGIRIKKYKSSVSFEKNLIKFLKRNHVLHLGTSSGDSNRVLLRAPDCIASSNNSRIF
jgi:hypothetical protein